jgi:hypothetical protein
METSRQVTRRQAQEYISKHHPQSQEQVQKHTEKTLCFYKAQTLPPTDKILWEWFQGSFALYTIHNFEQLPLSTQRELRAYLCCGGVYVPNNTSIAQALYKTANEEEWHTWSNEDIKECQQDLQKGPITTFWITPYRDLRLSPPFGSFDQEAIPLCLQYKKLPGEQPQNKQLKRQPFTCWHCKQPKPQPVTKLYAPQPSTCRHCKENFSSRNKLFCHLELCKKSQSQTFSNRSN